MKTSWRWFRLATAAGLTFLILFTSTLLIIIRQLEPMVFVYLNGRIQEVSETIDPTTERPRYGPLNEQLGYTHDVAGDLRRAGFDVEVFPQSSLQKALIRAGVMPPMEHSGNIGLTISDRADDVLLQYRRPFAIEGFDEVHPLVWTILLIRENEEFDPHEASQRNVAIELDRSLYAVSRVLARRLGVNDAQIFGGSGIALQKAKRFSPEGQTWKADNPYLEKLRQYVTASLELYSQGALITPEVKQRVLVDHINGVYFGVSRQYGAVENGLGEALYAWFGTNIEQVNQALNLDESTQEQCEWKATQLMRVLSLILGNYSPRIIGPDKSAADRQQFERLTLYLLSVLYERGLISDVLYQTARSLEPKIAWNLQERPKVVISYPHGKAERGIRVRLANIFSRSEYDLDRWNMTVPTTLDGPLMRRTENYLSRLYDREYLQRSGILDVLNQSVPQGVPIEDIRYVVFLGQAKDGRNEVLVATDTWRGQNDLATRANVEMGSTSKLFTLAEYLMINEKIYEQYRAYDLDALNQAFSQARDPISQWALGYMVQTKGALGTIDLEKMLTASMGVRISASRETFRTGGDRGYRPRNYGNAHYGTTPTIGEALAKSINLPFIRLGERIIRYYLTAELGYDYVDSIDDLDEPTRQRLEQLVVNEERARLQSALDGFVRGLLGADDGQRKNVQEALADVKGGDMRGFVERNLNADRRFRLGWLAGILKCGTYQDYQRNPALQSLTEEFIDQSISGFLKNHAEIERRAYFKMEQEAFDSVERDWRQLGFSGGVVVPSLATFAMGVSSGSLNDLVSLLSIIQNDGLRRSLDTIRAVDFGEGTPFKVHAQPSFDEERIMSPDAAGTMKAAMRGVVTEGTAIRVSLQDYVWATGPQAGQTVDIYGKTGTGDNQIRIDGRSIAKDRSALFTFMFGDYFGGVMVFVPQFDEQGRPIDAGKFRFTSRAAIMVFNQYMKELGIIVSAKEYKAAGASSPLAEGTATGPLFDQNGIAINEEGRRFAIESYQKAINLAIDWGRRNSLMIIEMFAIYGSFGSLKTRLPRLGVYQNRTLMEAQELAAQKQGPSDLDIAVYLPYCDDSDQFRQTLYRIIDRMTEEIYREYGVVIEIWEIPVHRTNYLEIAEVAGDGLVGLYAEVAARVREFKDLVRQRDYLADKLDFNLARQADAVREAKALWFRSSGRTQGRRPLRGATGRINFANSLVGPASALSARFDRKQSQIDSLLTQYPQLADLLKTSSSPVKDDGKKRRYSPVREKRLAEIKRLVLRLTAKLKRPPNVSEVALVLTTLTGDTPTKKIMSFHAWLKKNRYAPEDLNMQRYAGSSDAPLERSFRFGGMRIYIPPELRGKVKIRQASAVRARVREITLEAVGSPEQQVTLTNSLRTLRVVYKGDAGEIKSLVRKPASKTTMYLATISAFIAFRDAVLGIPHEFGTARKIALMKWLAKDGLPEESRSRNTGMSGVRFFLPSYYRTQASRIGILRDSRKNSRLLALIDIKNPDNFIVLENRGGEMFSSGSGERLTPQGSIFHKKRDQTIDLYDLSKCADFREFDETLDKTDRQKTLVGGRRKLVSIGLVQGHFNFWLRASLDVIGVATKRAFVTRKDRKKYPLILRRRDDGKEITIRSYRGGDKAFTVSGLDWRDGSPVVLRGTYFNLSVILELIRLGIFKDLVTADAILFETFDFIMTPTVSGYYNPIRTYRLNVEEKEIELGDLIDPDDLSRTDKDTGKVSSPLESASSPVSSNRQYKETPYVDEPRAKYYFETVIKLNLRLIDITARRIYLRKRIEGPPRRKRQPDLFESDELGEKLKATHAELDVIVDEINGFISEIQPARYPRKIVKGEDIRGDAKTQLAKAVSLISQRNEPAANVVLVSVVQSFAGELNALIDWRLSHRSRRRKRAGFSPDADRFRVLQGRTVNYPVSEKASINFRVYKPQDYELLWQTFRGGVDHQVDTEIVELLWLRDVWRILSREIRPKLSSEGSVVSDEDIQDVQESLAGMHLRLEKAILGVKDIIRYSLELALGLTTIDQFRPADTILGVALQFAEIRGREIKNIVSNIQRGRLKELRDIAVARNSELLNRTRKIIESLLAGDRRKALEATYGFLKARRLQVYFQEPEFWRLKQILGYAAWLIKTDQIDKAIEQLRTVEAKIDAARKLGEFMHGFRDLFAVSNLEKRRLTRQQAFNMRYQEFLQMAGLNKGSPQAEVYRLQFYRCAFIPLMNPEDKTEKNPFFLALDDLIIIQEIDDLKVILGSRLFKKRSATYAAIDGFLTQGKINYSLLPEKDKIALFDAIGTDQKASGQELQALALASSPQLLGASSPISFAGERHGFFNNLSRQRAQSIRETIENEPAKVKSLPQEYNLVAAEHINMPVKLFFFEREIPRAPAVFIYWKLSDSILEIYLSRRTYVILNVLFPYEKLLTVYSAIAVHEYSRAQGKTQKESLKLQAAIENYDSIRRTLRFFQVVCSINILQRLVLQFLRNRYRGIRLFEFAKRQLPPELRVIYRRILKWLALSKIATSIVKYLVVPIWVGREVLQNIDGIIDLFRLIWHSGFDILLIPMIVYVVAGSLTRTVILIYARLRYPQIGKVGIGRAVFINWLPGEITFESEFILSIPFQILKEYDLTKMKRLWRKNKQVERAIFRSDLSEGTKQALVRHSFLVADVVARSEDHAEEEFSGIYGDITDDAIKRRLDAQERILLIVSGEKAGRIRNYLKAFNALNNYTYEGSLGGIYILKIPRLLEMIHKEEKPKPSQLFRRLVPKRQAGRTAKRKSSARGAASSPLIETDETNGIGNFVIDSAVSSPASSPVAETIVTVPLRGNWLRNKVDMALAYSKFDWESELGKLWKDKAGDTPMVWDDRMGLKPGKATFAAVASEDEELGREFVKELILGGEFWKESQGRDLLFKIVRHPLTGKDIVEVYEGKEARVNPKFGERATHIVLEDAKSNKELLENQAAARKESLERIRAIAFFAEKIGAKVKDAIDRGTYRFGFASAEIPGTPDYIVVYGRIIQPEAEDLIKVLQGPQFESLRQSGNILIRFDKGRVVIKLGKKDLRQIVKNFSLLVADSDDHLADKGPVDDFGEEKEMAKIKVVNAIGRLSARYVKVGDTFELWQVRRYGVIPRAYPKLFEAFRGVRRLVIVAGNHDENIDKRREIIRRMKILEQAKKKEIKLVSTRDKELFIDIWGEAVAQLPEEVREEVKASSYSVVLSEGFEEEGIAWDAGDNAYYVDKDILKIAREKRNKAVSRLEDLIKGIRKSLPEDIQVDLGGADKVEVVSYYWDAARGLCFQHGHRGDSRNYKTPFGKGVTFVGALMEYGIYKDVEHFLLKAGDFLKRNVGGIFVSGLLVSGVLNYAARVIVLARFLRWYMKRKEQNIWITIIFGHTHEQIAVPTPEQMVRSVRGELDPINLLLREFVPFARYGNTGSWSKSLQEVLSGGRRPRKTPWPAEVGLEEKDTAETPQAPGEKSDPRHMNGITFSLNGEVRLWNGPEEAIASFGSSAKVSSPAEDRIASSPLEGLAIGSGIAYRVSRIGKIASSSPIDHNSSFDNRLRSSRVSPWGASLWGQVTDGAHPTNRPQGASSAIFRGEFAPVTAALSLGLAGLLGVWTVYRYLKPSIPWPYNLLYSQNGSNLTDAILSKEIPDHNRIDPYRVAIQVTHGCRDGCAICYFAADGRVVSMPRKGVRELFRKAKLRGHEAVQLSFDNEPFNYNSGEGDLADIVEDAHEIGLKPLIVTHGWDPDEVIAQRAAGKIAALPYRVGIDISFHIYHGDILLNHKREVEQYVRKFINVIGTLLPQRPTIKLFEKDGVFPQVEEAQDEVVARVIDGLLERYRHLPDDLRALKADRSNKVDWSRGRAKTTLAALNKTGAQTNITLDPAQEVNPCPYVFVFRPTGEILLYIDEDMIIQGERIRGGRFYPVGHWDRGDGAHRQPHHSSSPVDITDAHILIVDDLENYRRELEKVFTELGFRNIFTAPSSTSSPILKKDQIKRMLSGIAQRGKRVILKGSYEDAKVVYYSLLREAEDPDLISKYIYIQVDSSLKRLHPGIKRSVLRLFTYPQNVRFSKLAYRRTIETGGQAFYIEQPSIHDASRLLALNTAQWEPNCQTTLEKMESRLKNNPFGHLVIRDQQGEIISSVFTVQNDIHDLQDLAHEELTWDNLTSEGMLGLGSHNSKGKRAFAFEINTAPGSGGMGIGSYLIAALAEHLAALGVERLNTATTVNGYALYVIRISFERQLKHKITRKLSLERIDKWALRRYYKRVMAEYQAKYAGTDYEKNIAEFLAGKVRNETKSEEFLVAVDFRRYATATRLRKGREVYIDGAINFHRKKDDIKPGAELTMVIPRGRKKAVLAGGHMLIFEYILRGQNEILQLVFSFLGKSAGSVMAQLDHFNSSPLGKENRSVPFSTDDEKPSSSPTEEPTASPRASRSELLAYPESGPTTPRFARDCSLTESGRTTSSPANITLSRLADSPQIVKNILLVESKLSYKSTLIRQAAIIALGMFYSALIKREQKIHPVALRRLKRELDSTNEDIRQAAVTALDRINGPTVKEKEISLPELSREYIALFNQGRISLGELESMISDRDPAARQAVGNALTQIYTNLLMQGKMTREDCGRYALWTAENIPYREGLIDKYLSDPNSQTFIGSLLLQSERLVNHGFDYNNEEELWMAFLGVRRAGIDITWQQFSKRVEDLARFDRAHSGYFRKLFTKVKENGLKAIEVNAKEGRQLDIAQVDRRILDANLDILLAIRERIDTLRWLKEDFLGSKVFNLERLYYRLKRSQAVNDGRVKKGDEFRIKFPPKDEMWCELLSNRTLFFQIAFNLARERLTDQALRESSLRLMRDLTITYGLDGGILSQMRSDDIETCIAAFNNFWEVRIKQLPNSLGLLTAKEVKGLAGALQELSAGVYSELAKVTAVKNRTNGTYRLIPQGFLSVFRGIAGVDTCEFDIIRGFPYTRSMHEDTLYYFAYKGKELKGYVALCIGEDRDGRKILAIQTINSPSLDGEALLVSLFKELDGLARQLDCAGIALPENIDFYKLFNFDNAKTIQHMPVYMHGLPIRVIPLHADSWSWFVKMFSKEPHNSIEHGGFRILDLSEDLGSTPASSPAIQATSPMLQASSFGMQDLTWSLKPAAWSLKGSSLRSELFLTLGERETTSSPVEFSPQSTVHSLQTKRLTGEASSVAESDEAGEASPKAASPVEKKEGNSSMGFPESQMSGMIFTIGDFKGGRVKIIDNYSIPLSEGDRVIVAMPDASREAAGFVLRNIDCISGIITARGGTISPVGYIALDRGMPSIFGIGDIDRFREKFFNVKEYIEAVHFVRAGYFARGEINVGEYGDYLPYPVGLSPGFGRMIGDIAFNLWINLKAEGLLGEDEEFTILEAGADGLLAYDILSYIRDNHKDLYRVLKYKTIEFNEEAARRQEERNRKFRNEEKFEVIIVDAREPYKKIPPRSIKGFAFSNELLETNGAYKVRLYRDGTMETALLMPRVRATQTYITKEDFLQRFSGIGSVDDIEFVEIYIEIDPSNDQDIAAYIEENKDTINLVMKGAVNCQYVTGYLNPDGPKYVSNIASILAAGSQFMVIESGAETKDIFNPNSAANRLWLAPPTLEKFTDRPGSHAITVFQDISAWRERAKKAGLKELACGNQAILEELSPKRWLDSSLVRRRIYSEFRDYGHNSKDARGLTEQRVNDFRTTSNFKLVLWQKKISGSSPLATYSIVIWLSLFIHSPPGVIHNQALVSLAFINLNLSLSTYILFENTIRFGHIVFPGVASPWLVVLQRRARAGFSFYRPQATSPKPQAKTWSLEPVACSLNRASSPAGNTMQEIAENLYGFYASTKFIQNGEAKLAWGDAVEQAKQYLASKNITSLEGGVVALRNTYKKLIPVGDICGYAMRFFSRVVKEPNVPGSEREKCTKCGFPEGYLDTVIAPATRLCSVCGLYLQHPELRDFGYLRRTFDRKIAEAKKLVDAGITGLKMSGYDDERFILRDIEPGARYDCVVALSGGKDSVYMVYRLIKDHGMRVLCVREDVEENTALADDNIAQVIKSLRSKFPDRKVGYIKVGHRPGIIKEVRKNFMLQGQSFCKACLRSHFGFVYREAVRAGVPLVFFGLSRSQILCSLANINWALDIVKTVETPFSELDPEKVVKLYTERATRGNKEEGYITPEEREIYAVIRNIYSEAGESRIVPIIIPYYLFNNGLHPNKIREEISRELGWHYPSSNSRLEHSNCKYERFMPLFYKAEESGLAASLRELAFLVRDGQITLAESEEIQRVSSNEEKIKLTELMHFLAQFGISLRDVPLDFMPYVARDTKDETYYRLDLLGAAVLLSRISEQGICPDDIRDLFECLLSLANATPAESEKYYFALYKKIGEIKEGLDKDSAHFDLFYRLEEMIKFLARRNLEMASREIDADLYFTHRQNMQIWGIAIDGQDPVDHRVLREKALPIYKDSTRYHEVFMLFGNPSKTHTMEMHLSQRDPQDTPYHFDPGSGVLFYYESPVPFHAQIQGKVQRSRAGYYFPFQNSQDDPIIGEYNSYRELRLNPLTRYCAGKCLFCQRRWYLPIPSELERRHYYPPSTLIPRILEENPQLNGTFSDIEQVTYITNLYSKEGKYLDDLEETIGLLKKFGFRGTFYACATMVRSAEGIQRFHRIVDGYIYPFIVERFTDRNVLMGRIKGIEFREIVSIFEKARAAGFKPSGDGHNGKISITYIAGLESYEEAERHFKLLRENNLIDTVGFNMMTELIDSHRNLLVPEARDLKYYHRMRTLIKNLGFEFYDPGAFNKGNTPTDINEREFAGVEFLPLPPEEKAVIRYLMERSCGGKPAGVSSPARERSQSHNVTSLPAGRQGHMSRVSGVGNISSTSLTSAVGSPVFLWTYLFTHSPPVNISHALSASVFITLNLFLLTYILFENTIRFGQGSPELPRRGWWYSTLARAGFSGIGLNAAGTAASPVKRGATAASPVQRQSASSMVRINGYKHFASKVRDFCEFNVALGVWKKAGLTNIAVISIIQGILIGLAGSILLIFIIQIPEGLLSLSRGLFQVLRVTALLVLSLVFAEDVLKRLYRRWGVLEFNQQITYLERVTDRAAWISVFSLVGSPFLALAWIRRTDEISSFLLLIIGFLCSVGPPLAVNARVAASQLRRRQDRNVGVARHHQQYEDFFKGVAREGLVNPMRGPGKEVKVFSAADPTEPHEREALFGLRIYPPNQDAYSDGDDYLMALKKYSRRVYAQLYITQFATLPVVAWRRNEEKFVNFSVHQDVLQQRVQYVAAAILNPDKIRFANTSRSGMEGRLRGARQEVYTLEDVPVDPEVIEAILVPEHLFESARAAFADTKINVIPVGFIRRSVQWHVIEPDALELAKPLPHRLEVPDFESYLLEKLDRPVVFHCIRLPTPDEYSASSPAIQATSPMLQASSLGMRDLAWSLQPVACSLNRASSPVGLTNNKKIQLVINVHDSSDSRIQRTMGVSLVIEQDYWLYSMTEAGIAQDIVNWLKDHGYLGPKKRFCDPFMGNGFLVSLVNAMTGADATGYEKDRGIFDAAVPPSKELAGLGVVNPKHVHLIYGDSTKAQIQSYDVFYIYPPWMSGVPDPELVKSTILRMKVGAIMVLTTGIDLRSSYYTPSNIGQLVEKIGVIVKGKAEAYRRIGSSPVTEGWMRYQLQRLGKDLELWLKEEVPWARISFYLYVRFMRLMRKNPVLLGRILYGQPGMHTFNFFRLQPAGKAFEREFLRQIASVEAQREKPNVVAIKKTSSPASEKSPGRRVTTSPVTSSASSSISQEGSSLRSESLANDERGPMTSSPAIGSGVAYRVSRIGKIASSSPADHNSSPNRVSVLIIDDDPSKIRQVKRALGGGYSYFEASDGAEGLKELRQAVIDLIIVDCNMPEMSGEAFIREVVRVQKLGIPVILNSSHQLEDDALEREVSGFFDEGASDEVIRDVVEDVLARQAFRASSPQSEPIDQK
ncbi:SAM-dependent methyltransferase, partial [Candidatus Omnitrophota bacterium]